MSEHLTELKKQQPGTLVISIFHTLVCMCFMSQQRLISPNPLPQNNSLWQSSVWDSNQMKKAKSLKRKVTVTAINTGPNHTDQGGAEESSPLPQLGRRGPRGIGSSVRGFRAWEGYGIFLSPPTETRVSYKWGSCVTTTDNIFQLGRHANSHPCENISACSQQGLLAIFFFLLCDSISKAERRQHLGDTFALFYSTPNIKSPQKHSMPFFPDKA